MEREVNEMNINDPMIWKRYPSAIVPGWVTESSWDRKEIEKRSCGNLIVPEDVAKIVVRTVIDSNPWLMDRRGEYGNGSGQKETKSTRWIDLPEGVDAGQGGVVLGPDRKRLVVVKNPAWWSEEDREELENHQREVPDSAIYQISVVRRDLDEEREKVTLDGKGLGTTGSEFEFVIGVFTDKGFRLVNIQNLITALKENGVSASIEGWDAQFEHPSKPRQEDLPLSEHERVVFNDLALINLVCQKLGLSILPTSVMPSDGVGHSNFENPHVRHVLMRGMAAALGHDLTVEEASRMLAGYGVNGLHITVDLKGDEEGLVGDERLKEVFEHTHTRVEALMKVWTLSGNMRSVEDLVTGRFSFREEHRRKLATARVGKVRRMLDDEVVDAVADGKSPGPERASLCDEEGRIAAGVHNQLGRQKETGRNEFTIFDIEGNVGKVMQLEALLSLYTGVIDRAVLRDNLDEMISETGMSEDEKVFFLGLLSSQDEFDKLMEVVETEGVQGMVWFNGEEMKIGEILIRFIDWVKDAAEYQGIDLEDERYKDEVERIERLRWATEMQLDGKTASTFGEYFNPESEFYGVGTIGEIAYQRFILLIEGGESKDSAYNQVLRELSEAFNWHMISHINSPRLIVNI